MKALHKLLLQRFNESAISFVLGCFFGITVCQLFIDLYKGEITSENYSKMGFFISSCGIYHYMEFMYKSEFYNHDLSWHDFQIDHSKAYGIAMLLCLIEFKAREWTLNSYMLEIKDVEN